MAKKINLIPQNEFEHSNLGRIITWAVSSFRVMVIVTELIVMSAFLSRFWLDARSSDLSDKIKILSSQITAYTEIEKEFRSVQTRLNIAKTLFGEQQITKILQDISLKVPEDSFLYSINITGDKLQIRAISINEGSIGTMLNNFETDSQKYKDVVLGQIASNPDDGASTAFTFSATILKGGF